MILKFNYTLAYIKYTFGAPPDHFSTLSVPSSLYTVITSPTFASYTIQRLPVHSSPPPVLYGVQTVHCHTLNTRFTSFALHFKTLTVHTILPAVRWGRLRVHFGPSLGLFRAQTFHYYTRAECFDAFTSHSKTSLYVPLRLLETIVS